MYEMYSRGNTYRGKWDIKDLDVEHFSFSALKFENVEN